MTAADNRAPLGPQELEALVERIVDSGALGKSRHYASILRYLATCSIQGSSPKEMSIAIDVLQRDADFDISRDSAVRVHVFHLRNKLRKYFETHGREETFRLVIPKGQYELAIVPADDDLVNGPSQEDGRQMEEGEVASFVGSQVAKRFPVRAFSRPMLLALLLVAIVMNVWQWREGETVSTPGAAQPLHQFSFWSNLLDDAMPVLVIVGDYYIVGESGPAGQVERLVRDFDVNSLEDLRALQGRAGAGAAYVDLGLSYVPTGSSKALAHILPALQEGGRQVSVKTMSELRSADLASSHIVYLGLLSGLAELHDLMFADSGLYIGATYDELHAIEGRGYFYTSTQLSAAGSFLDYGMLSTFSGPRGNQFLMLAGMRDAGLVSLAEQAVDPKALHLLGRQLGLAPGDMSSLEALYRITGMDGTSFDTQLVHSAVLESAVIWEARLVGQGGALSGKH